VNAVKGSIGRGCNSITKAVFSTEHLLRRDILGNTSETPRDDDTLGARGHRLGLAGT
jgi:hypothetical protein